MVGRTAVFTTTVVIICSLCLFAPCCAPKALEAYPPGGSAGRVDLLVITCGSLLSEVERLARVKEKNGLRTAVVNVDGIDSHYAGRDLPEKMRACAIDYRKRKGMDALLLVGSANLVPTRYVYCPYKKDMTPEEIKESRESRDYLKYERYYVPTDLYFANHRDDWDINRNGVYGEPKGLPGVRLDEGGFSSQI